MNIADIKQIPISDFLSRLGIRPVRSSGSELFYHSPIASEKTPSFSVNDRKGYWNDFGRNQGGTIIDLGLHLFKTESVSEVVRKFSEIYDGLPINVLVSERTDPQANKIRIHLVQELGKNPALTKYLNDRHLFDTVLGSSEIKEVYYDLKKADGSQKRYFGIGWQNRSGGWEVSSAYGKLCIGKKDLTVVNGSSSEMPRKVNVFEGMFDYQAARKLGWAEKEAAAIILNSTSLVEKAIDYMKDKKLSANLFLDNDPSGDSATKSIKSQVESTDFRHTYSYHNDVNDFLMGQLSLKR